MAPQILLPYGIAIILAFALMSVSMFTVVQILATKSTVPLRLGGVVSQSVEKKEYSGVVSWVSRDSIQIVDRFGVSRVFTIGKKTSFLSAQAKEVRSTYTDVRVFGHVLVSTIKDANDEVAEVVTIL